MDPAHYFKGWVRWLFPKVRTVRRLISWRTRRNLLEAGWWNPLPVINDGYNHFKWHYRWVTGVITSKSCEILEYQAQFWLPCTLPWPEMCGVLFRHAHARREAWHVWTCQDSGGSRMAVMWWCWDMIIKKPISRHIELNHGSLHQVFLRSIDSIDRIIFSETIYVLWKKPV